MKFMTIADPDANNQPLQRSIGIDLGTTNSLVASALANGEAQLIGVADSSSVADSLSGCDQLHASSPLLPSVVAYANNGEICVGKDALAKTGNTNWQVFSSTKRYMGMSCQEIGTCPYDFDRDGVVPKFITPHEAQTPQEISAHILAYLYAKAGDHLGEIGNVVITVPAYFHDAQRQATKDAARLAGLPEPRLLNEPTAAAIAYGIHHQADSHIAVFDLGGGTFDISILKCSNQFLRVLVSSGDTQLGGDDFDQKLLAFVLQKTGIDIPPHAYQLAITKIRMLKEQLSNTEIATLDLHDIGFDVQCSVKRSEFEVMTQSLVDTTVQLTAEALRDANVTGEQLDHIVLVGGATRMPHILRALCQAFPETHVHNDLHPDTTVAIGAALHASVLSGEQTGRTLVDVIPLSLGIETLGGLTEKIIPRNTAIPVTRKQQFTTAKDGQTAFAMHLVQGERELVRDCRSLAKFTLAGIPPMLAGKAKLEVIFAIDPSGVLRVEASERTSGVSQQITSQPSSGLSSEEIADMIAASHINAKADMHARQLSEATVEGEKLIAVINQALESDGDLLTLDETQRLIRLLEEAQKVLSQKNYTQITETNRQLIEATSDFAQKRMNRALQQSLVKNLQE